MTINKTVAAILIGIVGWATAVVYSPSASITAAEWVSLATVILTAAGVYQIANQPKPVPAPPPPIPAAQQTAQ